MPRTIITKIDDKGNVPSESMLIEKSEFRAFLEKTWGMARDILAAIGVGAIIRWLL